MGPDRLIAVARGPMAPHVAVGGIGGLDPADMRTGKQRRHKPVRRLLAEDTAVKSDLQAMLMMSPYQQAIS